MNAPQFAHAAKYEATIGRDGTVIATACTTQLRAFAQFLRSLADEIDPPQPVKPSVTYRSGLENLEGK